MAVVEPGTGKVLALAVNRHYSLDPNPAGQENYPNTVNQLIAGGGAIQGYQAGSTFKMFTMLAALESGRSLDTGFDAPAQFTSKYPDSGPNSCNGVWRLRQRQPLLDGRLSHHVDRLRALGQHLLRLAGAAGRAG